MSKIETTSKVSLKLTSRINLGKRGAQVRPALDSGKNPQAPPPYPIPYPIHSHSPQKAKGF